MNNSDDVGSSSDGRTEAGVVLRQYLDALLAGDLGRIGLCFAEDATWSLHGTLPLSGTRRGREAILGFLVNAGKLFQPGTQRFAFGDITVQGQRAVLEWRVQSVATATGRDYDNAYCGIFVVQHGQISEVREYLDSLHAGEVLYGRTTERNVS